MFWELWARWQESVQLLGIKQLRLFLLVTIKAATSAVMLAIGFFWWGYALLLLGEWIGISGVSSPAMYAGIMLLQGILCYALLLALRPAIERKDGDYFKRYLFSHRMLDTTLLLCLPVLVHVIGADGSQSWWVYAVHMLCWPFLLLTSLFLLDTSSDVDAITPSIRRAWAVVLYSTPMYLLLCAVCGVMYYLFGAGDTYCLMHKVSITDLYANTFIDILVAWGYIAFLWAVRQCTTIFFIALVAMYYLKIKYDRYKLFFGAQVSS